MNGSPETLFPAPADRRSFVLGMITAFCECVAGGCKRLALSPPLKPEVYACLEAEALRIVAGHGLIVYVEDRKPGDATQIWVRSQLRSELGGAASASRWQDWCAWNLKRMGFTTTPGTSIEAPSDEDSVEEN